MQIADGLCRSNRGTHFFGTPFGVCFLNWGMIMKRFICLVCLLALLFSGYSVFESEPKILEVNYTQGIYKLTFHERLLSNDHVGHDWTFTYTHKGKVIKSGYTITQSLEIFTFQSIRVEIRENDQIDDVATDSFAVAICDGGSGKTTVTVTETNGRYKGNTAVWEITCEVELVYKE